MASACERPGCAVYQEALSAQESEVQAEYDSILREAKLLRLDLQHALTKCLERRVSTFLVPSYKGTGLTHLLSCCVTVYTCELQLCLHIQSPN